MDHLKRKTANGDEGIAKTQKADSGARTQLPPGRPQMRGQEEPSEGQFTDVNEVVVKRVRRSQRKWRGQKLHMKGTLGDIDDIGSAKDKIQT